MDILGNFIKECCVQNTGVSVRAQELFRAYQEWCEENNERACSEWFLGTGAGTFPEYRGAVLERYYAENRLVSIFAPVSPLPPFYLSVNDTCLLFRVTRGGFFVSACSPVFTGVYISNN
jgi:hypothetical protein